MHFVIFPNSAILNFFDHFGPPGPGGHHGDLGPKETSRGNLVFLMFMSDFMVWRSSGVIFWVRNDCTPAHPRVIRQFCHAVGIPVGARGFPGEVSMGSHGVVTHGIP